MKKCQTLLRKYKNKLALSLKRHYLKNSIIVILEQIIDLLMQVAEISVVRHRII